MTPEEFRIAAHALVDWVADHRARIPQLPVESRVVPGEIRDALPPHAPEQPEPLSAVMADLENIVVPGITQTQHPAFYGWFPSNASLASVLGDIASSGVAALGITWQSAPALTEVEQMVTEWLRDQGRPEAPVAELVDGPALRARLRAALRLGVAPQAGRGVAAPGRPPPTGTRARPGRR